MMIALTPPGRAHAAVAAAAVARRLRRSLNERPTLCEHCGTTVRTLRGSFSCQLWASTVLIFMSNAGQHFANTHCEFMYMSAACQYCSTTVRTLCVFIYMSAVGEHFANTVALLCEHYVLTFISSICHHCAHSLCVLMYISTESGGAHNRTFFQCAFVFLPALLGC